MVVAVGSRKILSLVADALPRDIVRNREIFPQVILRGNHARFGQRHDRCDGLETPRTKFIDMIHHVRVSEPATDSLARQIHHNVSVLDETTEGRSGETFAMASHVLRGVDTGKHSRLSRRALRQAGTAETRVDWN